MAFEKLLDEIRKEETVRGYSIVDIEKTRKKLYNEARDWERAFDRYIDSMLNDRGETVTPVLIIDKARKLADLRQQVLDEKFGDKPWEE